MSMPTPYAGAFVANVLAPNLAVSMGWTVVAEWIERPEELAACNDIGIA